MEGGGSVTWDECWGIVCHRIGVGQGGGGTVCHGLSTGGMVCHEMRNEGTVCHGMNY